MNQAVSAFVVSVAAFVLTGCGEAKFMDMVGGGKPSSSGNMTVQTNQNLAMPPDLRLPQPGTVTSEAQVGTTVAPAEEGMAQGTAAAQPHVSASAQLASTQAEPTKPQGDIYERNGISKTRPDGKPKSDSELQAELKEVYLAKKRQTDPGYGTIWNLGSLFKDG